MVKNLKSKSKILIEIVGGDIVRDYVWRTGIDFGYVPDYGDQPKINVLQHTVDREGTDKPIVLMLTYETWFELIESASTRSLERLKRSCQIVLCWWGHDEHWDIEVRLADMIAKDPSKVEKINQRSPKGMICISHDHPGDLIRNGFSNLDWQPVLKFYNFFQEWGYAKHHLNHTLDRGAVDKDYFFTTFTVHHGDRPLPFKKMMLDTLDKNNLLKDSINIINPKRVEGNEVFDDLKPLYPKPFLDKESEGDISNDRWFWFRSCLINYDFYNRTNFELVFEQVPRTMLIDGDDTICISEKTWKPITMKHPFLVVTNPGYWEHMKDLGFKDFSEHIDQSYDMESDPNKRAEKISSAIAQIIDQGSGDLYEKTRSICEHNFQNLSRLIGQYRNKGFNDLNAIFQQIDRNF